MITVKKSKEQEHNQCNSCLSKEGTFFDVEISSDPHSAMKIILCDPCLSDLVNLAIGAIDDDRQIPF